MNQNSLQTKETSPAQKSVQETSRLFFIDHLRVSLVILVVIHHVSIIYSAIIPFYYVEPPTNSPIAFLVLLIFALVNQAWFMGALFLLSGYFTPGSLNQKGPGLFLRERLLRLGIPLIVFFFIINPFSIPGIMSSLTWKNYSRFLGMGPMWFVAILFIFDLGYAGLQMLKKNDTFHKMNKSVKPSYLNISVTILALAASSYAVRIAIPIGKDVFGFPTLSYLPQYLSFFAFGIIASRYKWFETLPGSMGVVGLVTAAATGILLFPLAFSGNIFSLALTPTFANLLGKGHWQSAVYALWDSIFAVGMCLASITFFRRFLNKQGNFGKFLSKHSYTVYIIHIPIIVYLALALKRFNPGSLLKFGIISIIAVPTCFVVAYIVRKIPFASRIL